MLLAPSRHLVGGRSWGFGVGSNQRKEAGIYGHEVLEPCARHGVNSPILKPQTTNPGEEETWVRVTGLGWKLVPGWPGPCFWERLLLSLGVSTGEVFILQWYQAKSQAAPEMPYVFGIWQAQVGVCLQWVGGGSLFLGFFLVTVQLKKPWVTDPLTTVPPESVAIGCSWTSCVGELVSGPGISGNHQSGVRRWGVERHSRNTSGKGQFKL